jgi:hypothetical protein
MADANWGLENQMKTIVRYHLCMDQALALDHVGEQRTPFRNVDVLMF